MAFTAANIIQNAYYLANIKSIQAQDSLSVLEEQNGLNLLNQILDSLINDPVFSSYETILTIENITTPEIWIGKNINNPIASATVIDNIPFMAIYGANCLVNNSGSQNPTNYPLIIFSYTNWTNSSYVKTEGIPQYLYYTTISDMDNNNGVYNRILLDPSPNTDGIDLNLIGVLQYSEIGTSSDNILPTFSLFLQYSLAFELAMLYGKETEWMQTSKSMRKEELYTRLVSNNPLDPTISSIKKAYGHSNLYYNLDNNN